MNMLESALQAYQKSNGEKSGALFLGGETLYLFDEQYCSARCIWQYLSSPTKQLNLQHHQEDMLFWRNRKAWTLALTDTCLSEPHVFWSLLHIPVENQELLRVLLYSDGTRSYSLLFIDPMMEELLKTLLIKKIETSPPSHHPQIFQLLQEKHESNLHALTTLYLQGTKLSSLSRPLIPQEDKTT